MRILLTGASSFSGFWFARELAGAGHQVVCPIRRQCGDYSGIRAQRLAALTPLVQLVPAVSFGDQKFLELAGSTTWDVLCHHGAHVTNYRSADFDYVGALENNTFNLAATLSALKSLGNPVVVLTGTVFESDEGEGDRPLRAFSAYGLSKRLTWEVFCFQCLKNELPIGKFVIPNPFGSQEDERFTHYLMTAWREGKAAEVRTPAYIRDNIPVDLLAGAYLRFIERVASCREPVQRCNPSGYISDQGSFAKRVAREAQQRLGWACELKLWEQTDFSEPRKRVNTQPGINLNPIWNESLFWDQFCNWYSAKSR